MKKGGYDETALTSLSIADYSCVTPLVKAAMAKLRAGAGVAVRVVAARLRPERGFARRDGGVRAGGLTFAPEAGTQRMRDVIAKNVTEDEIIESAHRVFARGFSRMKLYFMIGLPTETDEDVRGHRRDRGARAGNRRASTRGAQVTASVSSHVPKPHTPFQWAAMDDDATIARKQALLAERARALRVDLKMHDNQQSHIEGIFARGDRRVGDLLEAAFRLDAGSTAGTTPCAWTCGSRRSPRRRRAPAWTSAGRWARCRSRAACPGATSTSASSPTSWPRNTARR